VKKSKTIYALLGWLTTEPMSGYDLKKKTEQYIGHFWYGSFGQIYPLLHKMLEEELVEVHEETTEGRPSKKVYSITDKGRELLREWMSAPTEDDLFRSEILLKIFFGSLASPEVLYEHIKKVLVDSKAHMKEFEIMEREMMPLFENSPNHPFMKINLDRGKIIQKGYIEWAENSLKTLKELSSENNCE